MNIYDLCCAQEEIILEREVTTVIEEIQRGISVYSNLLFVERFYETHGITKDFKVLIGNESIVDTIKVAFKRFWDWIVDQLRRLLTALREFFNKVVSRVLQFLGISSKGNLTSSLTNSDVTGVLNPEDFEIDDDTIQIPYDLNRIALACEYIHESLPIKLNGDENIPVMIEDQLATYKALFKEDGNRCYKRSQVQDVFDALGFNLNKCIALKNTLDNNATSIIKHVKSVPPERIDVKMIQTMFSKGNNVIGYLSGGAFVRMCKRFQDSLYEGVIVTDEIQKRMVGLTLLQTLSYGCTLLMGLIDPIPQVIRKVSESYNKDHAQIHIRYELDSDLHRRIEKELGGSLCISNIYVTSISPLSWPRIGPVKSVTVAACSGGTNRTGAVDIWVSARYLLKAKAMLNGTIIDNRRSTLIGIVHECVHCYDSQHGVQFDTIVNPKVNYAKYNKSSHEQRADDVSENFIFIDSDYRWIDRIIADVRRTIGSKKI